MLGKKLHGNKFLALVLKKYAKTDIKVFRFCLNFVDFIIFLKIFCARFSVETNASLKLAQSHSMFNP